MDMQPVAGLIGEGLCHEACNEVVFAGDGTYEVAQHNCVVAREQNIVFVVEIDLILAGRKFGRRTRCWHPLFGGSFVDFLKQSHEAIEFGDAIHFVSCFAHTSGRIDRGLRQIFAVALTVEHVEFKFAGGDGMKAKIGKFGDDIGEHDAWFQCERRTFIIFHRHQNLRLFH